MIDIIFEITRAAMVGLVLFFLIRHRNSHEISKIDGWAFLVAGFAFIFFGMLIDITDNFDSLNKYIIIGDTSYQSFLEKVVGYLLGLLFLAYGVFKWVPKIVKQTKETKNELENTASELKLLSGLLPICASCKKIRDDKGYWNQIESYIMKHSEAYFSHGLCEDCSDKLYGDEDWYQKAKMKRENKTL
jgi:hypothetical protein